MSAYEMNKLARTALTISNFKEELNKIIRERAEQGRFAVSVQVPREIVGNVQNYYHAQAYRTFVLKNELNTNDVVLHISWL